MSVPPDKIPAYCARHGLEENRDYVLKDFAVRARGTFEQAAEWIIAQARLARSQMGPSQ
ncbi:hypothetical protein EDD53_1880 [Pacificibacter maritimus]|uniref:Uncharacterized protein n=1 Tax=Pacificibacter maritimus TaxID=762213 RepID=A0A3N4V0V7_9RHOB|nr:hypothetical protein EDD53_1880 [Pacificibacter maritimus]